MAGFFSRLFGRAKAPRYDAQLAAYMADYVSAVEATNAIMAERERRTSKQRGEEPEGQEGKG